MKTPMDDKEVGDILTGKSFERDQAWITIVALIHKLVEERANTYSGYGELWDEAMKHALIDFNIDANAWTQE